MGRGTARMRVFARSFSKVKGGHHKPKASAAEPPKPPTPAAASQPPPVVPTVVVPPKNIGTSGSSSVWPIALGAAAAAGGVYYMLEGDDDDGEEGVFDSIGKMLGMHPTPPHARPGEGSSGADSLPRTVPKGDLFDKRKPDERGALFPDSGEATAEVEQSHAPEPVEPAKQEAAPAEEAPEPAPAAGAEAPAPVQAQAAAVDPAPAPAEEAAGATPPGHQQEASPAPEVAPGGAISEHSLVRSAVDRGFGPGEDFTQYAGMHRQAVADAALFKEVMDKTREAHSAELEAVRGEVQQREMLVAELESALQSEATAHRASIEQGKRDAALEVQKQKVVWATRSAESNVRERTARAQVLDDLRIKLNAMEQAFSDRSEEARMQTESQRLSMGVFALQAAMEAGKPFTPELSLLEQAAGGDPMVAAAAAALRGGAEGGCPTRVQLLKRFEGVASSARALGLVQGETAGPATRLAAQVAASLKLSLRSHAGPAQGPSPEAVVARAEALVASGSLSGAASELVGGFEGTAASPVVGAWARAARQREGMEQTVAMLQAYAAALALSHS